MMTPLWTSGVAIDAAELHMHNLFLLVTTALTYTMPSCLVEIVVRYAAWGCANARPFDGTPSDLPMDWMLRFTVCVQCGDPMCVDGFHKAYTCTWCEARLCRACAHCNVHRCDNCGWVLYTCAAHAMARVTCGCATKRRLCGECFMNEAAHPDEPRFWYTCSTCKMDACACVLPPEGHRNCVRPLGICVPCWSSDQDLTSQRCVTVHENHMLLQCERAALAKMFTNKQT